MTTENFVEQFDVLMGEVSSLITLRRYDAAMVKILDALAHINSQSFQGIIDHTTYTLFKNRLGDVSITLLIAMHLREADTMPPAPESGIQ